MSTKSRLLDRYMALVDAYSQMPPAVRSELHAWEREHVTGDGRFSTSDWPGWDRYVMPVWEYVGSATPDRVRRGRQTKRLPFRAVWDRDGWECVSCGSHRNLTVDHIVPVARGGSDDLTNLQTLCGSCNSSKGARI